MTPGVFRDPREFRFRGGPLEGELIGPLNLAREVREFQLQPGSEVFGLSHVSDLEEKYVR